MRRPRVESVYGTAYCSESRVARARPRHRWSRFRLSRIGTMRVDEVPGWAESGKAHKRPVELRGSERRRLALRA
jgi:hypothetical protein